MLKLKGFFHVLAIIFSSLLSMNSHGQTKSDKKAGQGSESELSKANSGVGSAASSDGSDDPPPTKLDPALMANAEMSTPLKPTITESFAPHLEDSESRYPWKRQIVTTTFWIGEAASKNNPVPNHSSSWDEKWTRNYGGPDEPKSAKRTAEFIPAAFKPGQNPFYIALPYNDMQRGSHKAEAAAVIPWFHQDYKGPSESVCKDRWIAVRSGNKVCYAQWADAGPFRTDHWKYVFGDERPKPNLNQGAGLDISPAVRDFLGLDGTAVTDWKFVDFDEIPTGPWAKYGENNTFVQNERAAQMRIATRAAESHRPL